MLIVKFSGISVCYFQTAEREKALREGNYHTWLSEEDFVGHEDGGHRDILKRCLHVGLSIIFQFQNANIV